MSVRADVFASSAEISAVAAGANRALPSPVRIVAGADQGPFFLLWNSFAHVGRHTARLVSPGRGKWIRKPVDRDWGSACQQHNRVTSLLSEPGRPG
jgi:hypothetical protein